MRSSRTSLRLEQGQRRHGLALPLQARAGVRVQHGSAPHINHVALGAKGRYRTNAWDYPSVNSFAARPYLKMHPTVKPVALIADAIRDCSNRHGIVLDPFGGSGSTMIAAERTGRKARLIELDAHYADTIVRRWQDFTGGAAVDAATRQTFQQHETARDAKASSSGEL